VQPVLSLLDLSFSDVVLVSVSTNIKALVSKVV